MKEQRYTLVPSGMVCSPSGEFTRWTDLQIIRQQAEQSVALTNTANKELKAQVKALSHQVANLESELTQFYEKRELPIAVDVLELLEEIEWHYEPPDDWYHKPSRWECPECSGEQPSHNPGCRLERLMKQLKVIANANSEPTDPGTPAGTETPSER